jgi:hypothetical protein
VVAWGYNEYGQTTVPVAAQSGVIAIAAAEDHTVALKNDGSVVAWGENNFGQTIVPIAAQSGVTAIAAGQHHIVARKNDGSVIAWGDNTHGQTTVPVAAQSGVTAIAAGGLHTVALKNDGSVVAWGNNDSCQATVPVAAQSGVTAIAAGYSHTIALIIPTAPAITLQPQGQTNVVGSVVMLSVEATGTTPLHYQWRRNSANLAGKTNSILVFTNLQSGNAGNYTVVVTNVAGSLTSAVAVVRVVLVPSLTAQPASREVLRGFPVTFSVAASGTSPLAYQWYYNGSILPDQTNSLLTLPTVNDFNAGNYSATVINPYGAVTSQVARLTVDLRAQVIVAPNALAANDGNTFQTSPAGGPTSVREMTIYDASEFGSLSGPAFLTQFAWRPDTSPGPSGPRTVTLRIFASTTSRSVAGLSTTFDENVGTNNTLVFSGTLNWTTGNLPGPANTRQFDVVFPFTTPFLYDPAAGNLLLDMQLSGIGEAMRFDAVTGNPAISKVINTSSSTATIGGLGVPEVIQLAFRAILSLRLTETNTVLISWPAPSAGFELQQNADLGATNWVAVSTAPATVGSEKQVIVPTSAGIQFYRLRRP